MASTYASNSGIELIATGDQSGTWGDTTNTNLQIIDRLTNGVLALSLSGTSSTLTTSDGALSDGQYKVLVLGGTPSGTHTITISPSDADKLYFVVNDTAEDVVFTQGSGGDVTIASGFKSILYADGGGAGAAVTEFGFQLTDFGVTATATELNIMDGVTATTAEINYLDVTTLGTSEASKAVTADSNGNIIHGGEFQGTCFLEKVVTLSGTTPSVDCETGNFFQLTTSGNTTFTFDYSNIDLTTADAYSFMLKLTAGGAHSITWPASVEWAGGQTPASPGSGETDIFVFVTADGGTTWYGALTINSAG